LLEVVKPIAGPGTDLRKETQWKFDLLGRHETPSLMSPNQRFTHFSFKQYGFPTIEKGTITRWNNPVGFYVLGPRLVEASAIP
jgi:hypothetical protein